jgi:hypothetical protein
VILSAWAATPLDPVQEGNVPYKHSRERQAMHQLEQLITALITNVAMVAPLLVDRSPTRSVTILPSRKPGHEEPNYRGDPKP